jgi:hypothetical protein
MEKVRSSTNVDDVLAHSTTAHSTKISKKKKKKAKVVEDLRLEDVNDNHDDANDSIRYKSKIHSKPTTKKNVKSTFYH